MRKLCLTIVLGLSLFWFLAVEVSAHCEIPCGIYDDEARIASIKEHIATIEKSMKQIMTLGKEERPSFNQLVRWIMNKEHHADQLQEIVSQYFMTQRIKIDAENCEQKLGLLHQMLVHGMKCKQTTELGHVSKLRALVDKFSTIYLGEEG